MTAPADSYEMLVRWYLRFNGYFGIENFVIHEPVTGGVAQGAEADVLAVRFPHSHEVAGFEIENDPRLVDAGAVRGSLIDFVIAEVKGGRRTTLLNDLWLSPVNEQKLRRVSYLVRWLGPFADEATIRSVAEELQARHRAQRDRYVIRVVLFNRKRSLKSEQLGVRQISFRDIAEFIVNTRSGCWQNHGLGVRSAHGQWDPMIKELWDIGAPGSNGSASEKIE